MFCPFQIDPEKYKKAVIRAILNIILCNWPLVVVAYYINRWRGSQCGYEGIPNLFTAVCQFIGILLVEEFSFYYSHRYHILNYNVVLELYVFNSQILLFTLVINHAPKFSRKFFTICVVFTLGNKYLHGF